MSDDLFQIKGSVLTTLILDVVKYDAQNFSAELAKKIQSAPQFFNQSPVMINLEKLISNGIAVDFQALFADCKANGLQPIGFRGAEGELKKQVESLGLPVFPPQAARNESPAKVSEPVAEVQPATVETVKTVTVEKLVSRPSKLIIQPVRSGQQIYAAGADLIVLSHVSEGAEVIADGHVHIYGALRGRAVAGAQGDDSARIFCRSMEAELISLAGNFVLNEDLRDNCWRQSAQCYLQEGSVKINPL